MKTNTIYAWSNWFLCDVHMKMNAHHVWKHNFLKLAKWRAVLLPPTCYQGTLSTTAGLIRWYQSLPRTCKGCKGHVWEARSWPERPPSQVVDAPFTSFPPDRLLHFLPGPCRTLFQLEGVPFPDTCPSCPLSTSISAVSLSFPLDLFALEIFTLALASKGDFDATSTDV